MQMMHTGYMIGVNVSDRSTTPSTNGVGQQHAVETVSTRCKSRDVFCSVNEWWHHNIISRVWLCYCQHCSVIFITTVKRWDDEPRLSVCNVSQLSVSLIMVHDATRCHTTAASAGVSPGHIVTSAVFGPNCSALTGMPFAFFFYHTQLSWILVEINVVARRLFHFGPGVICCCVFSDILQRPGRSRIPGVCRMFWFAIS